MDRLVEFSGLSTANPFPTLLPLSHQLHETHMKFTEIERDEMQNVPFRSVKWSLLYMTTLTRPDIVIALSMLVKFWRAPLPRH